MTDNLSQLKMILPFLAIVFAASVLVLCRLLIRLITGKVFKKARRLTAEADDFRTEKENVLKYKGIIRKETLTHTWIINAVGILCLGLLAAAALFRKKLIEISGMAMYLSLILALFVSASYCIFQNKRWKANAVKNMVIYANMFAGVFQDLHQGIRMMLVDSDTDFPLKNLLLEIQKNNPGMSGRELLMTAGHALESEYLMDLLECQNFENLQEKYEKHIFTKMEVFSSFCVILSFAVILSLCFLL